MVHSKKILLILSLLLFITGITFAQSWVVEYKCIETIPGAQQVKFSVIIRNQSGQNVLLSDLKLRYFYSRETVSKEEFHIEYAAIGSSVIQKNFTSQYTEISFNELAGTIPTMGTSGEIEIRINFSDWSPYNQENDWSFDQSKTTWTDWDRITLYVRDILVWGNEAPVGYNPTSNPLPAGTPGPVPR